MIQETISLQLSSTKSKSEFIIPKYYLNPMQYSHVAIAQVDIPISFYSIPQDLQFIVRYQTVDHLITIYKGSPTIQEFIDQIQLQLQFYSLPILIFQDEEKGYIDWGSDEEFFLIINNDDIQKYLGFPEIEAVPNFIYGYSSQKIVDFISHQILVLKSNIFTGIQYNTWLIINTTPAPQFSVFTQQFEIVSTMKQYAQAQSFLMELQTLDGEEIVFQSDVPYLIRLVFIKYQQYPIEIFNEIYLYMKHQTKRKIDKDNEIYEQKIQQYQQQNQIIYGEQQQNRR